MLKSFLQTQEWLDFQKSIGRKVWRFDDGKVIANIIQHQLPFGMNYLYVPHGPEINLDQISGGLKNELESFFSFIKKTAREEKSIFVKFEPLNDSIVELIYGAGLKKSAKEIQPHRSVILDLDKSEEELLAAMHHKTRYNIKVAEKYGITSDRSDDFESFWKLMQKTSKRDKFGSHPKPYYDALLHFESDHFHVGLILAKHEGKPVAGAILALMGNTAYYLHGASDHEFRSMMAPYALHWGIIKYLKDSGRYTQYDFWGIDAQKYPGVTRFKLNWGGRQVEYPGAFDLSIRPFWFLMYKILRNIF